jgi:peptidoglycan-associated lipoprotein
MKPWLPILLAFAATLSACATKPKPVAPQAPVPAESGSEESRPQEATPAGVASLGVLQAEFAAQAGDRVYFALDSYELSPEAQASLSRQAVWLSRHPEVLALVEGNCDERGTREYNLALGARRADAAKAFLVRQGVSAERLRTISYGKERPLDAGATEDAWARNRNAHSVLIDIVGR